MNARIETRKPGRQGGIAAVEFALMLFVLLLVGAGLAEFGRALWYYDAIAKGTRDAARHLSTVPTASLGGAVGTSADIVADAASAAAVPGFTSANVGVACAPTACGAALQPTDVTRVTVNASYVLRIGSLFPFISSSGAHGWTVTLAPHTTMPYMW